MFGGFSEILRQPPAINFEARDKSYSPQQLDTMLTEADAKTNRYKKIALGVGVGAVALTVGLVVASVFLVRLSRTNPQDLLKALYPALTMISAVATTGIAIGSFYMVYARNHRKEKLQELKNDAALDPTNRALLMLRQHNEYTLRDIYDYSISPILTNKLRLTDDELKELNLDSFLERLLREGSGELKQSILNEAIHCNLLMKFNQNLWIKLLQELHTENTTLDSGPIPIEALPYLTKIKNDLIFEPRKLADLTQLPKGLTSLRVDLKHTDPASVMPEGLNFNDLTHLILANPPSIVHVRIMINRCPKLRFLTVNPVPETTVPSDTVKEFVEITNRVKFVTLLCPTNNSYLPDYLRFLNLSVSAYPHTAGGGTMSICNNRLP